MNDGENPAASRRNFLMTSLSVGVGAALSPDVSAARAVSEPAARASRPESPRGRHEGNDRAAFPLGGLGAGMLCLGTNGDLTALSVRHRPDLTNEPVMFGAVSLATPAGRVARVLEGQVPRWKIFGRPLAGQGMVGATFGLPRFTRASMSCEFPFATVELEDDAVPLRVRLTGWSPFVPSRVDDSSLPCASLEYEFINAGPAAVEAMFSFHARNVMEVEGSTRRSISAAPGGFVLSELGDPRRPWEEGHFEVATDEAEVSVDHGWFRGDWFDAMTRLWDGVRAGRAIARPPIEDGAPPPGASLYVPIRLEPGESRLIAIRLSWLVPRSNLREGDDPAKPADDAAPKYVPWYMSRYRDVAALGKDWRSRYAALRAQSLTFARCFADQTLPADAIEAVAANLSILKSPTILRQADGRLWGWEGCSEEVGIAPGTCTHVWNYAQAIPHLFPELERTLRETEFGPSQDAQGHQAFRASLPIGEIPHSQIAAADGQLGGLLKLYRDWRICGDERWLRSLWRRARSSLDYCIRTWDPRGRGWLEEPHHNTYDVEFWGPDGMCTSLYLGALKAASLMGRQLGDDVTRYEQLLENGRIRMQSELFNGEWFVQKVMRDGLDNNDPLNRNRSLDQGSPELRALVASEGPRYQYGGGCLSDGVIGDWLSRVCGVPTVLESEDVLKHLRSVHRHNLKRDLTTHANPQRPGYACGAEGGLLLCTWPRGDQPALPFAYSAEVWTGIEYQVACHLILMGRMEEGLEIVRTCRKRYDGVTRNPFDEYEWGHWYARAQASYSLLQALSGARYDAVERVLHLAPPRAGDFRSFLSTATGFGTVGVSAGKPFFERKFGTIEVRKIEYIPSAIARQ